MAAKPFFETTLTAARIDAMTSSGHWPNDLLIDRFADRLAGRVSHGGAGHLFAGEVMRRGFRLYGDNCKRIRV